MEGELYNFLVDFILALGSVLYCHSVSKFIPQGKLRFLAFLPIIFLFFYLPLNLTTTLCELSFFFLAWLGNFKLILFAFGQGPLSPNPPLPLSQFILTTCLPIKIISTKSRIQETKNPKRRSMTVSAAKTILFLIAIKVYGYKDHLHPLLATMIYAYCIFIGLDILLVMAAFVTKALVGVELEPQFDKPLHATSVQNFWGKRWNLMVSSILRPTVYHPARAIFGHLVPQKWVSVPAVFLTFLVSGIMHEMIFYYMGRLKPTWDVTCFFLIQGIWVGAEIVIKKTVGNKFELPQVVAHSLTMAFVILTSFWLFFPPFLSFNPHVRTCKEAMAILEFFLHSHLVNPKECECPLF